MSEHVHGHDDRYAIVVAATASYDHLLIQKTMCAQEKATRPAVKPENQSMCCIAGRISPAVRARLASSRCRRQRSGGPRVFRYAQRVAERVLGRRGLGEGFDRRLACSLCRPQATLFISSSGGAFRG